MDRSSFIASLVEKMDFIGQVQRIETEASSGENVEPSKVERGLQNLASMAPDILDVTLGALISPIAGVSVATKRSPKRWGRKRIKVYKFIIL